MRKLIASNITTSFVSLLSSFVVVAIASFIFFSGYSPLVKNANAQNSSSQLAFITTGDSCNSTADCEAIVPGTICLQGQCGVNRLPTKAKTVDNFVISVEAPKENVTQLTDIINNDFQFSLGCDLAPCPFSRANGEVATDLTSNMTRMIGYVITTQPASSYIALADFMNNAGIPIAQPAYAQSALGGLGFASLSPILNAWKTFRNIAFLFFVIVILVIGFMIMFRQKVGQSAVTAQQAIPRVIIALITVSFSYAIAGLLIDGMYLLMTLMVYVFNLGAYRETLLGSNALDLGAKLVTSGATQSFEAIQALVDGISPFNLAGVPEFISGATVGLIVAIAIVFAMFRLFFELLKTYVTIIISIAIAPLLLMLGAIPGKDVFGGWVKGLIGNLAAFPIVLLVLILYDQLTGGFSGNPNEVLQGGFSPPYLFGLVQPGGVAQFFIGMGLLLMMTDLVKQGKKALGADEGAFGQFATGFGDALKKGWTGGELVPGIGLSDTRKWGKDKIGGVTAENFAKKAGVGAGGLAGGVYGSYNQMWSERADRGSALRGFGSGAKSGARRAVNVLGDEQLKKWANPEKKPANTTPKATS